MKIPIPDTDANRRQLLAVILKQAQDEEWSEQQLKTRLAKAGLAKPRPGPSDWDVQGPDARDPEVLMVMSRSVEGRAELRKVQLVVHASGPSRITFLRSSGPRGTTAHSHVAEGALGKDSTFAELNEWLAAV